MSENENIYSEYDQLAKNWRKAWEEWNEVMVRITLAFSKFENPPLEDLDLEERLKEQVDLFYAEMKEFQAILTNRQRDSK